MVCHTVTNFVTGGCHLGPRTMNPVLVKIRKKVDKSTVCELNKICLYTFLESPWYLDSGNVHIVWEHSGVVKKFRFESSKNRDFWVSNNTKS